LPEDVQSNNLSPRSELMTFIGITEGTKGYIFMRSPNNVVFTAIQALFNETLFQKCPTMHRLEYTPVGLPSDDLQGEHNGPLDNENEDYGGGDLPPLPPIPYQPLTPQGPPAARQKSPLPSPVTSGRGSPVLSYRDDDEDETWFSKKKSPSPPNAPSTPSSSRPNPPCTPHYWKFVRDNNLVNNPVFSVPIPTPPRPLPQPGNMNPFLRHSGRIRQPVFRPDNVYENQPPVDILAEEDDDIDSLWSRNQSPSPSGTPSKPSRSAGLMKMVQDGGAGLINFLLRAAVSSVDAKGKIPKVSKVCEWHYRDLMRLPKATQEEWKTACKEELEGLRRRNIFKLTNFPKGRKTIGCRWVFDVKSDSCKKARLVAQGFSQVEGIDFNELFSPVVCFESVQLILALSALEDYYCVGVDVRNAYLYGKLDKEIYMRQPEGFKVRGQENKVICLQRALYGLKQAGLAW
jgi:Reverse transcriptase (RNA-dependent DNA polymerase)